MTIYYTAKDIEEMAAKGIREIEVTPGITLTDFARETAQQLGISLTAPGKQAVRSSSQPAPPSRPAAPGQATKSPSKYNKPSGCMHGGSAQQAAPGQTSAPAGQSGSAANANTVNRLIDLMGKAIKRG